MFRDLYKLAYLNPHVTAMGSISFPIPRLPNTKREVWLDPKNMAIKHHSPALNIRLEDDGVSITQPTFRAFRPLRPT